MASSTVRSEIVALAIGMFKAAPGAQYLNEFVIAVDAGMSLSAIANSLTGTGEFQSVYPPLDTPEEFADRLVENLLGDEVTDAGEKAWATDWVIGAVNAGVPKGDIILEAVRALLATDAPAYANARLALENKVEVAEYYSVEKLQSDTDLLDLQSVVADVTSDPATVEAAKTDIDNNLAGETFNLTITGDIFEGNEGNDKILGNAATFSVLDMIDGAGGIDTITILGVDELGVAAAIAVDNGTVTNVENAVITASSSGLSGGAGDFSSWTGLASLTLNTKSATAITVADTTDVKFTNTTAAAVSVDGGNDVTVTNGAGTITVTGGEGLETVTTSGGTTVTIDDSGAETLTTVSISGNTGAATITGDALTSLTLANSSQDATITAAAGTRDLTVNKLTGGIIADATATTVNIAATGSASSGLTLTAVAAEAVTIDADVALTLADVNLTAAETLTVTGDSKVTLSALTDVTALTSIDASASTGGMTITPMLGLGVAFTGGSGVDTLLLGATTEAIALGGGNDVVTLTAAMGTDGTVTGGDGTDTVILNGPAVDLDGVTGFETLGLGALATGTYIATGFTGLTLGGVAAAVVFDEVDAGTTLTITAAPGFGVTYTLDDASGDSDSLPLTIKGAAGINANTITAADVENVAITSDDTATTLGDITHTVTIAGNDVETITVSGDAGLDLTATSTALTSLDASGLTNADVGVTFTLGANAAEATLTGSAGGDDFDVSAAAAAVTVNSGAGDDLVTVGNGIGLITVDVGEGDDTIEVAAAPQAAGFYTSVTGMGADDIIDFTGAGTALSETLGAKISLAPAATFANYLDAATASDAVTVGEVNWFQFDGNTYITVDVSGNATFADGVDSVIELVGLVDLSDAELVGGVLTLA